MKTKVTDLFGIRHPIIQGRIQWLACAEFVAAISEAGGLGTINATMHFTKQSLIDEIKKTKELTKKPFAVNISLSNNFIKKIWERFILNQYLKRELLL